MLTLHQGYNLYKYHIYHINNKRQEDVPAVCSENIFRKPSCSCMYAFKNKINFNIFEFLLSGHQNGVKSCLFTAKCTFQ